MIDEQSSGELHLGDNSAPPLGDDKHIAIVREERSPTELSNNDNLPPNAKDSPPPAVPQSAAKTPSTVDNSQPPKDKKKKRLLPWKAMLSPLPTIITISMAAVTLIITMRNSNVELKKIELAITNAGLDSEKQKTEQRLAEQKTAQFRNEATQFEKDRIASENKFKLDEWDRMQEAEDRKRLYTAIEKAESARTSEEAIASIATIRPYVFGRQEEFRRIALNALKGRLISAKSPTEIDLIFNILSDAGPEGMEIAIFANHRARQWLDEAIRAKTEAVALQVLSILTVSSRDRAFVEMQSHIHNNLASGEKLSATVSADLAVIAATLKDSRDTIARLLRIMPTDVNLDDCFLPNFYVSPAAPFGAKTISLYGTYLVGADLRGLDNTKNHGPKLLFGDKPQGSPNVSLKAPEPSLPDQSEEEQLLYLWRIAEGVKMTDKQVADLVKAHRKTQSY